MLTAAYSRSGYGRTGYLTQTLPVKGAKIYWAKTVWAWLVSLAGAALSVGIVLAVAPLVTAGNGGQGASVLTTVREAWGTLNEVAGPGGVTAGIIALVLMIIIWPAQYFFAVSVGSQAPLNRLGFAGPVLVWLGLYLATQVLVFASFAAVPLAVGMDGDRLGLVRFDLFAEMAAGASSTADVMPLGFLPALLVITAVCIGWSVRSWNRRVSLVCSTGCDRLRQRRAAGAGRSLPGSGQRLLPEVVQRSCGVRGGGEDPAGAGEQVRLPAGVQHG